MHRNEEIKHRIEEIMSSLDHVQRAVPKPYFFTRVMAKTQSGNTRWDRIALKISKPAFAVSLIIIFLLINSFILFTTTNRSSAVTSNESSQAIENDYGLSVSSIYDLNPEQNDIAQK
jgi:hypothetical protein